MLSVTCPNCDWELAMPVDLETGETPKPGDLAACNGCGISFVFNTELELENLPVKWTLIEIGD